MLVRSIFSFFHNVFKRPFLQGPENQVLFLRGLNFADMIETIFEKKKMLVRSIFSFSHNVFKRPFLQGPENQVLFLRGLNFADMIETIFEMGADTIGKVEHVSNQHFLFFPLCYQTSASIKSINLSVIW